MVQPIPPSSLLHSFRRHLEAENRSERTLASYLQSVQQAETFLAARGKRLEEATRADLEAFLGDLLRRRAPSTAATRYKVLRILYHWLEEEEEIEATRYHRPGDSPWPDWYCPWSVANSRV
jgi:site-specific recombinase XerD